jgi:hypothetical protein
MLKQQILNLKICKNSDNLAVRRAEMTNVIIGEKGTRKWVLDIQRIKFIDLIENLNLHKIINSINGISYCKSRLTRSSLLRCPYSGHS